MLDKLFNPGSVCIVGASNDKSKWSNQILCNLKDAGFLGKIYPVNPKGGIIEGLDVFKSVSSIPQTPEMVVIAVPAKFVASVMEDCGQAGITNIIIITAGFGEVGQIELANKNKELIKKYNLKVIGENTFGTISTHNNLNVSLIKPFDKKGGVNIYVQSGTLGIVLANRLSKITTIGLNDLVSMGNMSGINFSDLITYANNDNNCDVILLYIEDVKDGKAFIEAARNCNKPMVALKGGRSSSGAQAAASHTGALAGSDQVYQAAFKQAGVHLVDTIEELFMAAETLTRCKLPRGNRVGVLSPGGGANILCVDQLEKYGFIVPELEEVVQENIKRHLPMHAPQPRNPVDTAASFGFGDYQSILYHMTTSKEIDLLITNYVMTDGFLNDWKKGVIPKSYYTDSRIPIIGSWMGEKGCVKRDFEKLIPIFNEPSKAAWCASLLVQQKKFMEKK